MKKTFKKILFLNKKEGETPLCALDKFREDNPKYKNIKMTYAGRLDPMASGLLLIVVGDEIKNKEKYLALEKEYEFEVLFGFATDTYDILGKITSTNLPLIKGEARRGSELQDEIKNSLKFFTGKFIQKYPMYSSKTVKGQPLFAYARKDLDVEIPERVVFVKSLKFLKLEKIKQTKLLINIEKRIKKVKGDFRQKEIIKLWRKNLIVKLSEFDNVFVIAKFKIRCSSGTYVRGIANSLGESVGIPALAFSIKRTKIGNYR